MAAGRGNIDNIRGDNSTPPQPSQHKPRSTATILGARNMKWAFAHGETFIGYRRTYRAPAPSAFRLPARPQALLRPLSAGYAPTVWLWVAASVTSFHFCVLTCCLYAPSREVSGPVVRRACLLRHHKLIQAHTTHVQRAVDFVEAAAKWPVPLPVLVPRFLRVATGTCVAEGARSQQPLPPWPVPMPRPRAV